MNLIYKKAIFILICLLSNQLFAFYIPPSIVNRTYVVDNNYGVYCKYRTVSSAISAASDGDTIYIMPSQTPYDGFTVNKRLYIYSQKNISSNGSQAIISLSSIVISNRASVLEGLQITSNFITINGNSTTINNCYISSHLILNSDSNKLIGNNFNFSKNEYLLFYATSNFNKIANNHIEKFQFTALSGTIYPFVDGADSSNQILNNIFLERENGNKYAPKYGFVFFKNSSAIIENNIFWSEIDDRAAFDTLAYNCKYNKNITYSRFNSPTNLQDTGNFNDTFVSFKFHDNYSHTIPFYFNDPDNFALKNSSIGKNSGTDSKDIGVSGGIDLYRAHGQKNNSITVENIKVPSKVINKDTLKLQLKLNTQKDTFACNNFNLYCATIDSVFYSFDTTFQLHEGNQKLLFVGDKSLIDTTLYLSLDSMSLTAHTLIISMRSTSGVWSYHTSELFNVKPDANFYNFSNVEYAFETDSNSWNQVSFTPNDTVDMFFEVNIDNLPTGAHSLLVRTKLSNGLYSTWQMHPFYIKGDSLGDIEKLEYTFDKDTARDKWTQIAISPSDSIDILSQINIDHLTLGHHTLLVRTYIGGNLYSPWQMHPFFIKGDSLGDIEKLEYTFDKDTARDKWTQIAISPSDSIDILSQINIDHLSLGHHALLVRTYIGSNLYSPWQMHPFYIKGDSLGDIEKLEYTFDKDTAKEKWTQIAISPSDSIDILSQINIDHLTLGHHALLVRTYIGGNLYSPWQMHPFFIHDSINSNKLISYTYSIDSSLHNLPYTFKKTISPTDSINTTFIHALDSNISLGVHYVHVWAQQSNTHNTTWHIDTFEVIDCPMLDTADFTINNNLCLGNQIKFKQDITKFGIWGKDSFNYKWHVDNSLKGTSDSLLHTFNSADTFKIKLSFTKKTNTKCKGEFTKSIIIHPSSKDTVRQSICGSDSVLVHGLYRKTSGTYTYNGTNQYGCDSISTFILTTHPVYTFRDTFTLCNGDSILKHTKTFKTAGTYTTNFTTNKGCDSTWITKINVNPVYTFIDTFTLCNGDSVLKHTKTFKTAGTYTTKFTTIKGCDSTWITKINVNPVYTFRDTFTLCNGDSVLKHTKTFKTAGTYTTKFTTIKGCDSTWITKINVNPVYTFRDTFTFCNGDSVIIHNKTFKTAGTYTTKFTTIKGCDSTWITKINVNPVYTFRDTFTLCNGDSALKHTKTFKTAGTYTTKFTTIKGCDSTWITKIIVNPVYTFRDSFTLCNGDSVLKHTKTFKTAGTYTTKFFTNKGCDSSWITKINVNPVYTFRDTFTLCNGDSVLKHTKTFKTAGTYTTKFSTIKGCDSTWITKINVNPVYTFRDTFTFCNGDSVLKHTKTFKTAGTYTIKFTTIKGCDSTWITKIIVNPTYHSTTNLGLCSGDSVYFQGSYKKTTGVYTASYATIKGCDSLFTLNLNVENKILVTLNPVICYGDSFLSGGYFKKLNKSYYDTLIATKGCDSIVITNLTIRALDSTHLYQTICAQDTLQFFNQKLHQTGIYLKVLKNKFNCDSFVYMNLNVRPLNAVTLNRTICNLDSVFTGNSWKKNSGTYIETLVDKNGCDSIVTSIINVNPTYKYRDTLTLCQGSSISKHGQIFSLAGSFTSLFNTNKGCDSIWITQVYVNPIYYFKDTLVLCQGNSITKHGQTFSAAGIYTNSFSTSKGCDSIWITKIIVNPIYTFRDTFTLCQGNSITKHGQTYSTAGIFTSNFNTTNGCDSIWITKININPSYHFVKYDTICGGDNINFFGDILTRSGKYLKVFNTVNGCDSIYENNLFVRSRHQVIILSTGFNQLMTDSVYSTYQWYLNRNILAGKTSRTITANQQGVYDVSVTNQHGCTWTSWDNSTSLQDLTYTNLKVYPNPANEWLKIVSENDNLILKCYDNLGKLILTENIHVGENSVQVNELSEGVYYIQISGNGSFYQTKIVIVK